MTIQQLERAERIGMIRYIEKRGWRPDSEDQGRWRHDDGPDSYTIADLEEAYRIELGREKARLA